MSRVERSVDSLASKGKLVVRLLILGFPVMFLLLLATTVAGYFELVSSQALFSVLCSYVVYRIVAPRIICFMTVTKGQVSPDQLDDTIFRPPPLEDE